MKRRKPATQQEGVEPPADFAVSTGTATKATAAVRVDIESVFEPPQWGRKAQEGARIRYLLAEAVKRIIGDGTVPVSLDRAAALRKLKEAWEHCVAAIAADRVVRP